MQTIKTENSKSNLTITKRIRTTNYIVGVHFNATGKENIKDKILRLIKNDIANEK
ncbi:MAG: transposon-encoded TnpW family protein [Peptococcaceae bacterium]|nr:transposon-encoded TnpW family protein [Peptococcaceae bacterium]